MKYLLLGGTGFIGYNLQKLLIRNGNAVTVTGRGQTPKNSLGEGVQFRQWEIRKGLQSDIFDVLDSETVIIYSLPAITDPKLEFSGNFFQDLDCLHNLLNWLKLKPLKKIVFLSSGGGIYGNVEKAQPIPETTDLNPVSLNGYKKLLHEQILNFFSRIHHLPIVIIRPGNPYGPHQEPFKGQGLVATALGSILHQRELSLFGADIVRDYIYIDDFVEALYQITSMENRQPVYNIGSGIGLSNYEVLNQILNLAKEEGLPLKYRIDPKRAQDTNYNVLSIDRLTREYGWSPKISFDQGLRETWKIIRNKV